MKTKIMAKDLPIFIKRPVKRRSGFISSILTKLIAFLTISIVVQLMLPKGTTVFGILQALEDGQQTIAMFQSKINNVSQNINKINADNFHGNSENLTEKSIQKMLREFNR